jgi:formiminotetrahydrofolate cyclodeaminase
MGKKDGKPRGKMSSYAFFVQTCREEHKKKHPGESVVFAEFSKKCSEKWKQMTAKEKRRFEEMAEKDKARYNREMENYDPPAGEGGRKRKRQKDPNAPKRALSAFFFFCNEERPAVRKQYPNYAVGDVAKELGKRWESCSEKPRFEVMAQKDKKRYEAEMAAYKKGGSPAKKSTKVAKKQESEEEEDDDDEEEEEDEDEDDDDDDDE